MKLLYKPFGIALGVIAGILGRKAFDRVWALIDDEQPPNATTEEVTWTKALLAAGLQASIFALVRTAVTRGGATYYRQFTGVWPGEKRQERADAD